MAEKNETAVLTIRDLSEDGSGIGQVEGKTVFVKDTAVGDTARIRILKEKKNYAFGRLEEILTPSDFRVSPKCPVARACGGCTLQHISYSEQLRLKAKRVADCLGRIGGIEAPEKLMEPILGMDEPFYFRNKMQFPVGLSKDGRVKIGFYAGRTHSIIDTEDCVTGHPVNRYILAAFRRWVEKEQSRTGGFVYDEKAHKGVLRHLMTRVGCFTGEVMVVPVVNGAGFARSKKEHERLAGELVEALQGAVERYNREKGQNADSKEVQGNVEQYDREKGQNADAEAEEAWTGGEKGLNTLPERNGEAFRLVSVVMNVNSERTNRILGEECVTLYGEDHISDCIGENRFLISPLSFFQVNPLQTGRLYGKALEYAGLTGKEKVWDMYCGAGTISLSLEKAAAQVFGVEIVPQAVENARENAKLNQRERAEFFVGKAEDVVPSLYRENPEKYRADVVVVDPPRKGCEASLLATILEMAPERIVYVSCDPATLARDVRILTEGGYRLKKAVPVDMFPQGMHVEVVSLLQRVSNTRERTITLDVEMEDYHRIKNGTGVTADATE